MEKIKTPVIERGLRGKRQILHRYAAIGASVLSLGSIGVGTWNHYEKKEGDVTHYAPEVRCPVPIDEKKRIISKNMHNQTKKHKPGFRKLIAKYEPDALMLQEVSKGDARWLHRNFPCWDIKHVTADAKFKFGRGNGNIIMSRQYMKDTDVTTIQGTSLLTSIGRTAFGTLKDATSTEVSIASPSVDVSLQNARHGMQESRAGMATTIKVRDEGYLKSWRLMTGHIAGLEDVHDSQLSKMKKFIDLNLDDGRPLLFCGDLNAYPHEIRYPFAKELGLVVPRTTGYTSISGRRTVDYCAYTPWEGMTSYTYSEDN